MDMVPTSVHARCMYTRLAGTAGKRKYEVNIAQESNRNSELYIGIPRDTPLTAPRITGIPAIAYQYHIRERRIVR